MPKFADRALPNPEAPVDVPVETAIAHEAILKARAGLTLQFAELVAAIKQTPLGQEQLAWILRDFGISTSENETIHTLSRSFSMAELDTIVEFLVGYDAVEALGLQNERVRKFVFNEIAAGRSVTAEMVNETAARLHDEEQSYETKFVRAGHHSFDDAHRRNLPRIEETFRTRAKSLLGEMIEYDDLVSHNVVDDYDEVKDRPIYTSRDTLHKSISRNARVLLVAFEEHFGCSWPPIRDWGHLALQNDIAKHNLPKAHFSLKVLASGHFHELPSGIGSTYRWSSLEAMRFLAAMPELIDGLPVARRKPEQHTILRAVDFAANLGTATRGVEAGAFAHAAIYSGQSSLTALRASRPDWNLMALPPRDAGRAGYLGWLEGLRALPGPIDLLSGDIASAPWEIIENGQDGPERMMGGLRETLEALQFPKSFFIEIRNNFLEEYTVTERQEFFAQFEAIGYSIDVWHLDARNYGLRQKRARYYIVGVLARYSHGLRPPISHQPLSYNAKYAEALFPKGTEFFHGIAAGREPMERERSARQVVYDTWAIEWLKKYNIAPDVNKNPLGSRANSRPQWAKRGFDSESFQPRELGDEELAAWFADFLQSNQVGGNIALPLVPVTEEILRHVNGIPLDWSVEPLPLANGGRGRPRKYPLSFAKISESTPPVMASVVARAIHRALSGEDFNLEDPATLVIGNGRADQLPNTREFRDSRRWGAERWSIEMWSAGPNEAENYRYDESMKDWIFLHHDHDNSLLPPDLPE
jgi:hypothetical protein